MISALKGDQRERRARMVCAARMPRKVRGSIRRDQAADIPSRLLAAEVTLREKLYLRLHDELPYAATVETELCGPRSKDGSVRIDQVIYVERDSQKSIVLGQGAGRAIKAIGEASRRDLEEMFGRRVHLFLFVKVRENWAEEREHYGAMGLEFPEE